MCNSTLKHIRSYLFDLEGCGSVDFSKYLQGVPKKNALLWFLGYISTLERATRLVIENAKRKKCLAGIINEFELHDSP